MRHRSPVIGCTIGLFVAFFTNANAVIVIKEDFRIISDDLASNDAFGISAGVSNGVAVVGAFKNSISKGAAYVFDATTGAQQFKLAPTELAFSDNFGFSVAIDGNAIVAGAPFRDEVASNSGAAYVFNATTGAQTGKLVPLDASQADQFGYSAGVDGSIAIIGADRAGALGFNPGAAYVFDINTETQLAKLVADDGDNNDRFGIAVDVSGNTAIVGAPSAGAAYLFDIATGDQLFKFAPAGIGTTDFFGSTVAIDGQRAVVGSFLAGGGSSGEAYVFDTNTGDQLFKLTPSDQGSLDDFGYWVDVSDNLAIIGARSHSNSTSNTGAAYIFDIYLGQELAKLELSDSFNGRQFGQSVAIDGNLAIVGDNFANAVGSNSGAAYVFLNVPEPNRMLLLATAAMASLFASRRRQ